MKKIGLAFAVGALMLLSAPSALAQTSSTTTTDPYQGTTSTSTSTTSSTSTSTTSTTAPPGSTSTTIAPTSETESEGTLVPGQTVVFDTCFLQANSSVSLTLNGVNIGSDTVEGDGCARQTVTVGSAGNAGGVSLVAAIGGQSLLAQQGSASVIIDGRTFTARVGQNTLVVAGTQPNGAPRTVTHVFNITGSATGGTGGLARTGGMIAKWTLAGLALIGLGYGVVAVNRRRQQAL